MVRFQTRLRRKRHGTSMLAAWWAWWRAPIFLTIIMGVWWFILRPATAPDDFGAAPFQSGLQFGLCGEKDAGLACVIDGDTLYISSGNQARRIRITGYDAPELDGACEACLLYTSPSPRDKRQSRMPSSA